MLAFILNFGSIHRLIFVYYFFIKKMQLWELIEGEIYRYVNRND